MAKMQLVGGKKWFSKAQVICRVFLAMLLRFALRIKRSKIKLPIF